MYRKSRWAALMLVASPAARADPDEARLHDVAYIFHPARIAETFGDLGEKLLLFAQTAAVLLIIGGLLARLRKSGTQLEHIASMVLLVGFISTVPLWKTLVLEVSDALADSLGNRAVASASLASAPGDVTTELSPFMLKLGELEEQWRLASSPFSEGLDGVWRPDDGREEERLGRGWNWTKPPLFSASVASEQAWTSATAAERAGFLQRIIVGTGLVIRLAHIGYYFAESLRWLLFHAGFSFVPLMVAGLGTDSFRNPALRCLLGLVGVALWPAGWSAMNAATSAMMTGSLDIYSKTAHAALYPEVANDAARTIAQAAPYLSWSLTSEMAAIALALCFWMILSLVLVPVLFHVLIAAGARWTGLVGRE